MHDQLVNNHEVEEQHLKINHLTQTEREVNNYRDIYYLPGDKLTCTSNIQHEIPLLPNSSPINVSRIPEAQKEEINKQVEKLLANDIICPSSNPYNAPIFLVPNKMENSGVKNGEWPWILDV